MGDFKPYKKRKKTLATDALISKLEELELRKSTGRLTMEVNIHHGGIVNASISVQEPVFKKPPKDQG